MNGSWMRGWRNWRSGFWRKVNLSDKQTREDFLYEKKLQKWQKKKLKARRMRKPFDLKMPEKPGLAFFGNTGEVDETDGDSYYKGIKRDPSGSPPRR